MELFVPIKSYFKQEILELFNNEGQPKWDLRRLNRKIENNELLLQELEKIGYEKKDQFFTGEQVQVIFKYLGRPVMTEKNQRYFKRHYPDKSLEIIKLFNKIRTHISNATLLTNTDDLAWFGLHFINGGDFNPHYKFTHNPKYYFELSRDEKTFYLKSFKTLMIEDEINTTDKLIVIIEKLSKYN